MLDISLEVGVLDIITGGCARYLIRGGGARYLIRGECAR